MTTPQLNWEIAQARVRLLSTTTDAELLTKAANLIASEPVVAGGSFRVVLGPTRLRQIFGNADPEKSYACHCLEGAVREAAGVYRVEADGVYHTTLTAVEVAFELRRKTLDRLIVRQLNRYALASILDRMPIEAGAGSPVTLEDIDSGSYPPASVIYRYSDLILAPMGAAGPAEAARILRDAAAEAAKEDAARLGIAAPQ